MATPNNHTAIRVDASLQVGAGHLMRCLSLADALGEKGGQVRFICRRLPSAYASMIRKLGHELIELEGPEAAESSGAIHALSDRSWNWLVVDHYALDARWETELRACAARILAIDDLADRSHDCDALLDQNVLDARDKRYDGKVPQSCRLLLGPGYALLRSQFGRLRESALVKRGPVLRILILMGGMDAGNQTEKAIRAVARTSRQSLEVDVVVGADHPALARIRTACERHGYRCHVQVADVASLMARADLAIGGCGTTSWERCCLGLPSICLTLAANQRRIAEGLAARGAIVHLGNAADVDDVAIADALLAISSDAQRLAAMSAAAHELVDGKGARRVCDFMIGAA